MCQAAHGAAQGHTNWSYAPTLSCLNIQVMAIAQASKARLCGDTDPFIPQNPPAQTYQIIRVHPIKRKVALRPAFPPTLLGLGPLRPIHTVFISPQRSTVGEEEGPRGPGPVKWGWVQ